MQFNPADFMDALVDHGLALLVAVDKSGGSMQQFVEAWLIPNPHEKVWMVTNGLGSRRMWRGQPAMLIKYAPESVEFTSSHNWILRKASVGFLEIDHGLRNRPWNEFTDHMTALGVSTAFKDL